nr:hypothetical protein CFP56_09375 [Quercus suber]
MDSGAAIELKEIMDRTAVVDHMSIMVPLIANHRTAVTDNYPQRDCRLYHPHDGPEVLPECGLELASDWELEGIPECGLEAVQFRDRSSDKCVAVEDSDDCSHPERKCFLQGRFHAPRIIFGMKLRTFLMVAAAFSSIKIGTVVDNAMSGRKIASRFLW